VEPGQAAAEPVPVEAEAFPAPPRERRPASPAAIQQAIQEVNQIIETLRRTLEDMDEVLETLELAERQQNADEHEIETLRRSLRQLHRPHDGGHHSPRH
jgi:vacuolar-type H+-ATPase subunit I/STV1